MTTCKHKVGLLTLRDCDEPAASQCSFCKRPICQAHRKIVTTEGQGVAVCVECYLQQVSEDKAIQAGVGQEYTRRGLYRATGYQAYYYGEASRYGADDYRYFDRNIADVPAETADHLDAQDFQES